MITPKFTGTVDKGKFVPDDKIGFMNVLHKLEGKDVWAKFEDKKAYKQRSDKQNRYLHGVICYILSDYTGFSPEEMKAVLKYKFGIKSTSALSTAESEEFFRKCREFAASELGCYVPLPGEVPFDY